MKAFLGGSPRHSAAAPCTLLLRAPAQAPLGGRTDGRSSLQQHLIVAPSPTRQTEFKATGISPCANLFQDKTLVVKPNWQGERKGRYDSCRIQPAFRHLPVSDMKQMVPFTFWAFPFFCFLSFGQKIHSALNSQFSN